MDLNNERLLSIQDLAQFMGVSREHVRRYIITQAGFPKPIRVMPNAHPPWKYSEILEFIDSRRDE